MKKHNVTIEFSIIFSILIILLLSSGCTFFKKNRTAKEDEFEKNKTLQIYATPKTLISDYERMKEDSIVSWLWVKPGFDLNACGNINILPVENYSNIKYPWAAAELTQNLKKVFSPYQSKTGKMNIGVSTAIIDLIPKKRFFKSSVIPKIAIELIIFDESTKTVCCKISHFKKAKEFKDALNGLTSDLKNLSNKTLRK